VPLSKARKADAHGSWMQRSNLAMLDIESINQHIQHIQGIQGAKEGNAHHNLAASVEWLFPFSMLNAVGIIHLHIYIYKLFICSKYIDCWIFDSWVIYE
jgi:hypothetical protein